MTTYNNDANLNGWSHTDQASPLSFDNSPSVPTFQVTKDDTPLSDFGTPGVLVTDDFLLSGVVSDISLSDNAQITVTSKLDLFNVCHTVPPYRGSLSGLFDLWATAVGFDYESLTCPTRTVMVPGFSGVMWPMMQSVLFLEQLEFVYDPETGVVTFQDYASSGEVTIDSTQTPTITLSRANPGEYVDVTYYVQKWVTKGELYPPVSDYEDNDRTTAYWNTVQILTIDPGIEQTFEIQTDCWFATVNQPDCVTFVQADPGYYNETNGVYSVAGNDGLGIVPSEWSDFGGSLTIAIAPDDPSKLLVTIRGAMDLVTPIFNDEGPDYYDAAFAYYAPFAVPGPYKTVLSGPDEASFRSWVSSYSVPFDPDEDPTDYDMRGYWQETGGAGWMPGDHFPDTYKTPYDTSFSAESKYATRDAPFKWDDSDRLVDTRTGQTMFDGAWTGATGLGIQAYGPYQIAMADGNYFNSLRVTGTGVQTIKSRLVHYPTGANPDFVSDPVSASADSPFINSKTKALRVAARLAAENSGFNLTASVSDDSVELSSGKIWNYQNIPWRVESVQITESGSQYDLSAPMLLGTLPDVSCAKDVPSLLAVSLNPELIAL